MTKHNTNNTWAIWAYSRKGTVHSVTPGYWHAGIRTFQSACKLARQLKRQYPTRQFVPVEQWAS